MNPIHIILIFTITTIGVLSMISNSYLRTARHYGVSTNRYRRLNKNAIRINCIIILIAFISLSLLIIN